MCDAPKRLQEPVPAAHRTPHTLLSFRYFIAAVSNVRIHLEVGCAVEWRAVKQCWLACYAVRLPLVSFRFIIVFPTHAYEANNNDHLAFCGGGGMTGRKGTPLVNTVNSGSVENCVNNACCVVLWWK